MCIVSAWPWPLVFWQSLPHCFRSVCCALHPAGKWSPLRPGVVRQLPHTRLSLQNHGWQGQCCWCWQGHCLWRWPSHWHNRSEFKTGSWNFVAEMITECLKALKEHGGIFLFVSKSVATPSGMRNFPQNKDGFVWICLSSDIHAISHHFLILIFVYSETNAEPENWVEFWTI